MSVEAVLAGQQAWAIVPGHVLDGLAALPDGCVQTVVTSPPYWGLRSYGTDGVIWGGAADCRHEWERIRRPIMTGGQGTASLKQISNAGSQLAQEPCSQGSCARCGAWRGELGSENAPDCLAWARGAPPCPACYVCHLRTIWAALWRVLRADGTCWVNLGDSYANRWPSVRSTGRAGFEDAERDRPAHSASSLAGMGLKPKDLCGLPWRVALALQADGWWLRSAITLCKVAPMPEGVRDRPTSATEMLFLLAKSGRYFYDSEVTRSFTDTAGATNGTALGVAGLTPELNTTARADDGTPHLRGRGDLSESEITIDGTMAWQAKHFEIVQTIRLSIVIEEAEREFMVDLQPFGSATTLADVISTFQDFAANGSPVRATIVDAATAEGGAGGSDTVQAIPSPSASTGAESVLEPRQLLTRVVEEGYPALIAFHRDPSREPLLVLGTFRPSHAKHDTKNTGSGANMRNWMLWRPEPLREQHYASFPTFIPARAIQAGTSERGGCAACGAPWVRVVARGSNPANEQLIASRADRGRTRTTDNLTSGPDWHARKAANPDRLLGWVPSCQCDAGDPVSQIVCDPFAGSGTTGVVATRLGRRFLGLELNPEYVRLAERRIIGDSPLWNSPEVGA